MKRSNYLRLFTVLLLFAASDLSAQWGTYAPMPGTRWAHVCAESGGKLYVLSGSIAPTYEYDPGGNSWTTKASIPTLRSYPGVASWNGMIYVLGGSVGAAWSDKNERYDPATDTWTTLAPMPQVRTTTAAAAVNGKIYVMNGWNGTAMSAVDVYDIATDTWGTAAAAPTARSHAKTAIIGNLIYLVGGYNGGYLSTNEVYDPGTNTWQTLAPMPTARYIHAVGEIGNKVYVAGGYTGGASSSTQSYDTGTGTWTVEANMPTARYRTDGATVGNCFYVLGGYNGVNLATNEAFCGSILAAGPSLEGDIHPDHIQLRWTDPEAFTAQYYVMERREEGGEFHAIAELSGDSKSMELGYTDWDPPAGHLSYRLQRTDQSGSQSYSNLFAAEISAASEFCVGWDAEDREILLTCLEKWQEKNGELEICDLLGRVWIRYSINEENILSGSGSFHLPGAPEGVYLVRLRSAKKVQVKRLYLGGI